MLTNVKYSQSERSYKVTDPKTGEIAEFPCGTDGRRKAFRLGVWLHEPALHDMADKISNEYPMLEARAWQAVTMIVEGKVKPLTGQGLIAKVEGSSEYGDYNIIVYGDELACDCIDFTGMTAPYLANGQRYCKHILAVLFARELTNDE